MLQPAFVEMCYHGPSWLHLASYMKVMDIILVREQWEHKPFKSITFDRLWKWTITNMLKNMYFVRSLPTLYTTSNKSYIMSSLHDLLRSGGWTLLALLLPAKAKVKFLLVDIDYFTKWTEVKPLVTITTQQVQKFV